MWSVSSGQDGKNIYRRLCTSKSSRYSGVLDALSFKQYINDGYIVYLYAPKVENADKMKNCIQITDEELMTFYKNNKSILPDSITKWENLIKE